MGKAKTYKDPKTKEKVEIKKEKGKGYFIGKSGKDGKAPIKEFDLNKKKPKSKSKGRKKTKQPLRGIAKVKHIQAGRSPQERGRDAAETAKKVYKPTKKGTKKWKKDPSASDMKGIDTKGHY